MGFSNTAATTNLVAKLTPYGRQQLLLNKSSIITHFALGDSDANYNATLPLTTGEVPEMSGNLGKTTNTNNSTAMGYKPRSVLFANSLGSRKKSVNIGSDSVTLSQSLLGQNTISGGTLTFNKVVRTDTATDSLVNLFYSFRLPISTADDTLFTVTPSKSGGFADTALSGLAQTEIAVIGLPSTEYGEMLDGKTLHLTLENSGGTFNIYGTYEKTLTKTTVLDAKYKEESFSSAVFGNNIVFLFSDDIQRPNNDITKSWATGNGTVKPFSVNNKSLFNMYTNTATNTVADKVVGIAHLDEGFIVLTHPTIVSGFNETYSGLTASTLFYDSVVTQVTQEIICMADRGEFGTSSNPTFSQGDTPRISEVLLMDINENIVAVAKPDRHIEKTAQQLIPIGLKITV